MSPSWHDRVSIFLEPARIHLARRPRGLQARSGIAVSVDCGEATGAPWQGALEALGRSLGTLAWQGADARVTVSNHFVRFALVPEAGKLRNDEERLAAARHHLRAVYGERAEPWRIVLGGGDETAVAAGIEPELVDGLLATLTAANLRPIAIEPYLATAFNLCRRAIGRGPAWLAVAEPHRLCLAYFDRGAWQRVRSERVRAPLEDELPAALERSRLADGGQAGAGRVLLVSREESRVEFPHGSGWSLEPMRLDGESAPPSVRH